MNGIIVVNKPSGISSFGVVRDVRRKLNVKRVGHAGTLDPLATGVLIMLVGKATKLFDKFMTYDKAYRATLRLGTQTVSSDITGEVIQQNSYENISRESVIKAFGQFEGEIDQVAPMVSAVKVGGKRLYKLARQGIKVERPVRRVSINSLKITGFFEPDVEFTMECSKGTYVRQLAEDVGQVLGCGACITQIERTRVGAFDLKGAVNLEDLNEMHVRKWDAPEV